MAFNYNNLGRNKTNNDFTKYVEHLLDKNLFEDITFLEKYCRDVLASQKSFSDYSSYVKKLRPSDMSFFINYGIQSKKIKDDFDNYN